MAQKFTKLEDLTAYKIASELSDYVWNIVIEWDYFVRSTIGRQYVEAVDSVAANIAEGFGRYYKKDKIRFFHQAKGSVFETAHWTKKARKRRLITTEQNKHILEELRRLPKEINNLIKLTKKHLTI